MAEQVPSIGRVVHFVNGDTHVPALITAVAVNTPDPVGGVDFTWEALTVFPPMAVPFTTLAPYVPDAIPGSWHWPEYVPAK